MVGLKKILICSDLDRTIIPNGYQEESAHARALFCQLAEDADISLAYVSGRDKKLILDAIEEYHIPYQCLVPQNIDGLLVAGRCISCDHESLGTIRTIPTCMVTGQAAGVAAAVSAKQKIKPRNLDVRDIQNILVEQKAVIFDSLMQRMKVVN